jgi:hypothetical protein
MSLGIIELAILGVICIVFLVMLIGALAAVVYFAKRSKHQGN